MLFPVGIGHIFHPKIVVLVELYPRFAGTFKNQCKMLLIKCKKILHKGLYIKYIGGGHEVF